MPRADVVAFLDIDAELLAPRYRAAEQAMALLVRGARLVGGRRHGGRLLVQTFLPRHEVVQAALLADPGRLVEPERARRRLLGLPPFAALAAISGAGSDERRRRAAHGRRHRRRRRRRPLDGPRPDVGASSAGRSSPPPAPRAPASASRSTPRASSGRPIRVFRCIGVFRAGGPRTKHSDALKHSDGRRRRR